MDKAFLNWYTQSLGGIIGLIACMMAYLNGDMAVYGNIFHKLDEIGIGGFLASYTLIPLCIIITLLGAIESYKKNMKLEKLNKNLVFVTILIGFLGSKLFFIIPSLFILFQFYSNYSNFKKDTMEMKDTLLKVADKRLSDSTQIYKDKKISKSLEKTKNEMALDLLLKGADKLFISELTGLSLKEIEELEHRLK